MYRQSNTRRPYSGALTILAIAVVATSACTPASGATTAGSAVRYGEAVALGKGNVRSYVTMVDGVPSEVGIAVSEGTLQGLPGHHSPGGVEVEPGHMMFERVVPLPADNPTPFGHVVMNWNPGGHEPPGIYDTPHFDFHFYMISNGERTAIDPADPTFKKKAEHLPDAALIPAGYILPAPVGIPQMGVHWVDPKSPELNGKPFSTTFIYGSWDGDVIFAEPMITKAFLESKPQFDAELPAPQRYADGGYYPTGYSVRWDEASREWHIALTKLVKR